MANEEDEETDRYRRERDNLLLQGDTWDGPRSCSIYVAIKSSLAVSSLAYDNSELTYQDQFRYEADPSRKMRWMQLKSKREKTDLFDTKMRFFSNETFSNE